VAFQAMENVPVTGLWLGSENLHRIMKLIIARA